MARSHAYRIGQAFGFWLATIYVVGSLAIVPVAFIAWIWGMDARIMATVVVNAFVALVIVSMVVA